MRYCGPEDLALSIGLTTEHLNRAQAKEEPYYQEYGFEYFLDSDCQIAADARLVEQALGQLSWLELPYYPVPSLRDDSDDSEQGECVIGMAGVSEAGFAFVEQSAFKDQIGFGVFSRSVSLARNSGVVRTSLVRNGGERSRRACVSTEILIADDGIAISRRHGESTLEADMASARCEAIIRAQTSDARIKRLRDLSAPDPVIAQEAALLLRYRKEASALFGGILPPSSETPKETEDLQGFLRRFGFDAADAATLAEGKLPRSAGQSYRWVTHAKLGKNGLFVLYDEEEEAEIEPLFPKAPATDAERAVYHTELRVIAEGARRIVFVDLPRVTGIGARYGRPVTLPE